jgi:signal transduction histidine kinase
MTNENQQKVLENIVRLLAEHLGANSGYILTKNEQSESKEQLAVLARYVRGRDDDGNTFSNTLINKTLQIGRGQLVQNAMNNKEFFGDPSFQTYNIKSAICVPVKTPRDSLGVMYFDSSEEKCEWNEPDLNLLETLAGFIGLAIENNQLQLDKQKNSRLIAAGHASLHISHSIKNILQLIGGAEEVIDFGLRTDQIHRVKRSWDILKPNLERIKEFTLEMLDFSREHRIELGPCEFNRVVQDAIDSLRAQLKQKDTKLHIRVDPRMPTVKLDGKRIYQMIVNLILNALDVVDEQTGVVEVQTRHLADDSAVELTVSDNGPGLDKDARKNVFLPYQSTKSKNRFKTGLGLAIAKQIVDQHKGQIKVESEPGKGSTFKVTLPCRIVQESA